MSWFNSDGLYVKFGREEQDSARGKEIGALSAGRHVIQFDIDYRDLLSATDAILGSVTNGDGTASQGIVVPKAARIEAVETLVKTAFTSSGTIGTSTLVLGLKKTSDRSTELDHDGFLTSSYVGSKIDAAGERNYQEVGTTGSGALIGTSLAEEGVVSCSNSQNASHPYTAGVLTVRLYYRFI